MSAGQLDCLTTACMPVTRLQFASQTRLVIRLTGQHQQAQALHLGYSRRAEHLRRTAQVIQRQHLLWCGHGLRTRLQVAHQRVQHAAARPAEDAQAGQQRQALVPRHQPQQALAPGQARQLLCLQGRRQSFHSRPTYRLRPSPGINSAASWPRALATTPVVEM